MFVGANNIQNSKAHSSSGVSAPPPRCPGGWPTCSKGDQLLMIQWEPIKRPWTESSVLWLRPVCSQSPAKNTTVVNSSLGSGDKRLDDIETVNHHQSNVNKDTKFKFVTDVNPGAARLHKQDVLEGATLGPRQQTPLGPRINSRLLTCINHF